MLAMTHPSFFFFFFNLRNDYAIRNTGWEVSNSTGFCQRMLICRKQNVSQKRLCLDELPMKHRQVSTTSPPDFLPACLAPLQAPRLWDGSGLNLWFFLTFFFFFKLEGKGLGRNTHWLCLAFSDCSELGILITRTSHGPVSWFVMWEAQSSFPPFQRSCSG